MKVNLELLLLLCEESDEVCFVVNPRRKYYSKKMFPVAQASTECTCTHTDKALSNKLEMQGALD